MTNLSLAFKLAALINSEVTKFSGFTIVSGDNSSETLEQRLRKVIIEFLTKEEAKVLFATELKK